MRDKANDKYMFYTKSQKEWMEKIEKAPFGSHPKEDISYKVDTKNSEAGTIMIYPTTGIIVVNGDKGQRKAFRKWFKKEKLNKKFEAMSLADKGGKPGKAGKSKNKPGKAGKSKK